MTHRNPTFSKVFVAGCGDLGRRVLALWQQQGQPVSGLVRTDESLDILKNQGITGIQGDLGKSACELPVLGDALVYYFVPPPRDGVSDEHCRHFLQSLEKSATLPRRIVAISTSGVYGDRGGALVSEDDTPNPSVDRARRRLDMEQQLTQWCEANQCELIILRVGGIYGPGRLPLDRIKKAIPIIKPELSPSTNRIHIDDLSRVCIAAAAVDFKYRIYNVSDGNDSTMTEYFFTLADFYHLPRPPVVDWDEAQRVISAGMLSYLKESRRLDVSRMQNELDITLLYPDLLSGLAAMTE